MLKLYFMGLAGIMCFCFMIWLWYLRTKLASVIDVAWSLGILIAGSVYLFMDEINVRKLIVFGLLLAWSLRLSGYIYWTRIRLKLVDKRYENLSSNWTFKNIAFLGHYWLQGFLMSIIAIPFYFISTQKYETLQLIDYVAISIFVFAFVLECISDWQLSNHKKKSSALCDTGLWKFSRHPNYFFEWIIWIAFALFATFAENGLFAFASPICLLFIVTVLTGPMTERASLKSRGENYKAYQKRTSYFIPWFRKT